MYDLRPGVADPEDHDDRAAARSPRAVASDARQLVRAIDAARVRHYTRVTGDAVNYEPDPDPHGDRAVGNITHRNWSD